MGPCISREEGAGPQAAGPAGEQQEGPQRHVGSADGKKPGAVGSKDTTPHQHASSKHGATAAAPEDVQIRVGSQVPPQHAAGKRASHASRPPQAPQQQRQPPSRRAIFIVEGEQHPGPLAGRPSGGSPLASRASDRSNSPKSILKKTSDTSMLQQVPSMSSSTGETPRGTLSNSAGKVGLSSAGRLGPGQQDSVVAAAIERMAQMEEQRHSATTSSHGHSGDGAAAQPDDFNGMSDHELAQDLLAGLSDACACGGDASDAATQGMRRSRSMPARTQRLDWAYSHKDDDDALDNGAGESGRHTAERQQGKAQAEQPHQHHHRDASSSGTQASLAGPWHAHANGTGSGGSHAAATDHEHEQQLGSAGTEGTEDSAAGMPSPSKGAIKHALPHATRSFNMTHQLSRFCREALLPLDDMDGMPQQGGPLPSALSAPAGDVRLARVLLPIKASGMLAFSTLPHQAVAGGASASSSGHYVVSGNVAVAIPGEGAFNGGDGAQGAGATTLVAEQEQQQQAQHQGPPVGPAHIMPPPALLPAPPPRRRSKPRRAATERSLHQKVLLTAQHQQLVNTATQFGWTGM